MKRERTHDDNRAPADKTASRNFGRETEAPTDGVKSSGKKPPSTTRKRPTATSLATYGDLLRAAYGPVRRRWKPTSREMGVIQANPGPSSAEHRRLLDFSESDVTLKKTRELMLFGMKRLDGTNPKRPIRGFVRDVLHRHPAYQSKSLQHALAHPDIDLKQSTVHVLDGETRRWHERSGLPKRQVDSCLMNVLHCLLLWRSESQSASSSLQETLDYLREEIWTSFTRRRTSESEQFRALIGDRDPRATSIACARLTTQTMKLERQLEAVRADAKRLQGSLDEVTDRWRESREELKNTTARNADVERSFLAARNDHADEKAHMRDDFEKMRSSVAHRIKAELSLLTDGLHALRRNPPKLSVMDDHAERAIDGLTRELERLREPTAKP